MAKLTIASLDLGGDTSPRQTQVVAQYNPREIQMERALNWVPHNAADNVGTMDDNQAMHLEFTGPTPRSLTVELLFDGVEHDGELERSEGKTGKTVGQAIETVELLARIRSPGAVADAMRRPHHCVVSWGSDGLPPFRCVIAAVSTRYQMFSASGKVLRATCTVKLTEADVLALAKAETYKAKQEVKQKARAAKDAENARKRRR